MHRGMPELYLEGSAVHGCQLSLVIEHLLKVRDMPVLVGGVAVKPLQRPCEDDSTPHFQGVTGTYPQRFILPDRCGHGCPHGPSS